jgi:serine/threonine protein kinase
MNSFPIDPFYAQPDIIRNGLIGTGAFGDVWKARWFGQIVAVKFLRHVTDETRADFAAEVEKLETLQNLTSVVQIKGKTLYATQPYYWMEFCGPSLDRWAGKLPKENQLNLFYDLVCAIEGLHQHGILHRDIKPLNLLTKEISGVVRPVIADFGTARSFVLSRACNGSGTPIYTAPEIFNGAKFTPAADVYSLGITMYEMITGAPYRPLLDLGVPGNLADILAGMTNVNPLMRPALANVRRQLETIMEQRAASPFWNAINSATTGEVLVAGAAGFAIAAALASGKK